MIWTGKIRWINVVVFSSEEGVRERFKSEANGFSHTEAWIRRSREREVIRGTALLV
jgi:hypothetical protein